MVKAHLPNREASNDSTDEELLPFMLAGDENAFTILYRRRQASIFRFALQMTGSKAIAEEITQETFMTLVLGAEKFNPSLGSLSSFLYGIARNCSLRLQNSDRRSLVSNSSDLEASWEGTESSVRDPLTELARNETIDVVRRAVLALPQRYREVVVLCDLNEMSYEGVASVLGCSIGTVRSRLHRGRSFLLKKLQEVESLDSCPENPVCERSMI